MTPKTFLESFRHVINAPLGVSRLREMVYALAISGSLCPQRAEDGTGHQLLEQIAEGKDSRIRIGVFKRSPKLEGSAAKYSDSLPRIPHSWAWSQLVDLGEINPRNDADDDILVTFAPMNAISELHNGPIRSEDRKWASIKKGFTHFADGDVMVAKITPCFENGKGAVLRGLTNGIGAGTTELHVVRPLPGVLPEYIYVFLRSPHFKSVGESHMTGTAGQKRLSTEYFALREFPLPPLEEQKRIVAKVDELMRLCDRLEAQQQEREELLPLLSRANHARFVAEPTEANLRPVFPAERRSSPSCLRETVLSLAVKGLLVRQDETDQPTDQLMRDILSHIQASDVRQASRLAKKVQDVETTPFPVPESWKWIRLGAISESIEYGTSHKADSNASNVPVYRMGDIQDGELRNDNLKYVPRELDDLPSLFLQPGDILFNRTNSADLVGKAGIFRGPPDKYTFASYLIRVRLPKEFVNPDYINLCFLSPYFRATQIAPELTQQCGQANFNGTKLANTLFPLPPKSTANAHSA